MVWVNAPCWYSDIHHPHNISKNGSTVMDLDGIQRKAERVYDNTRLTIVTSP